MRSNLHRPLFPNWASAALTVLVATAVLALIMHLAAQNRQLAEALASQQSSDSRERTPAVGDLLPPIQLASTDGTTESLRDLVAGGAVVAFLTTTCRYCEASLPQWNRMASELRAMGIPFVAVSLHDRDLTQAYADTNAIEFLLWSAADASTQQELRVSAVPLTVRVSATAEIIRVWRGQLRKEQADEVILNAHAMIE